MADYNSSYTGAQIDSAVGKASKLPTVSSADGGKILLVNSSGNIVPVSPSVTASNIDSGTATNGQVLTANGSGGASWQNAGGGGGTQLYLHKITGSSRINWAFVSTTSTPITRLFDLNDLIKNSKIIQVFYIGDTRIPADIWCTALLSLDTDVMTKTLTYYNNQSNSWVNTNVSTYGFTSDTVTAL